jgi:ArsR family transcriptional regulator
LQRAVELFAALSDPSRLRLMEILQTQRHCVSELAAETESSLSSVSQRLKQLARARLVTRTRQGKHVYYSLTDDHVRNLLSEVFDHVHE